MGHRQAVRHQTLTLTFPGFESLCPSHVNRCQNPNSFVGQLDLTPVFFFIFQGFGDLFLKKRYWTVLFKLSKIAIQTYESNFRTFLLDGAGFLIILLFLFWCSISNFAVNTLCVIESNIFVNSSSELCFRSIRYSMYFFRFYGGIK